MAIGGQPLLGVARARPEVHGQLAAHAHRASGPDLPAGRQVEAEGVGDRFVPGFDVSLKLYPRLSRLLSSSMSDRPDVTLVRHRRLPQL